MCAEAGASGDVWALCPGAKRPGRQSGADGVHRTINIERLLCAAYSSISGNMFSAGQCTLVTCLVISNISKG